MAVSAALAAGALLPAQAASAIPALIAEVQTALDRGDAQHAANLAEGALKEESVSVTERSRLLVYHGLAEELLGASQEAMRDFTSALATRALPAEERAQALLQRGFLSDGLGRLDEAAADYGAVIALKGEGYATALNNRANVYRRQNRLAEARRDYQAALAAGGKAQYAWYGLGQIAETQGDKLAARGFYAKAVAADPGYALASERLATLGGAPEGAIANPDGPITLKPPSPATNAAPPAEAPLVLHPPAPKPPITLRLPRQNRAGARARSDLSLRPALDQSATAAPKNQVQLGAWRSEAEARAGWDKARGRAGGLLEGLKPHLVVADLPGRGRYYRLRVSPVAGQSAAQFCESLTAKGLACFPAWD